MGRVVEWLARRGSPGVTARWALNAYRTFRVRYPDPAEVPDSVIFRHMIATRYETRRNERTEQVLLAKVDDLHGLMGLVIEILVLEAYLADNAPDSMRCIVEVVADELRKSGLTDTVIFGSRVGSRYFVTQAFGDE